MDTGARPHSFMWRLWPLLIAGLALLGLVIASSDLASGTADSAHGAERRRSPTPPAKSMLEPFPHTESMTDTVRAVLEAYEQATDGGRRRAVGPVRVRSDI